MIYTDYGLKQLPHDAKGNLIIKGEIIFFNNGIEVGRTGLPTFTNHIARHQLAENLGIKEYNNFHLIKEDGTLYADASKTFGMTITGSDNDVGTSEGWQYQLYLKSKKDCKCYQCGADLKRD